MLKRSCLAATFLVSISCAASAQTATVDTLRITVFDENNTGVRSQVFVYKTPSITADNQILFGETDDQGTYVEKYKCEPTQVVIAHPINSGAYFYSYPKPCKQQIDIPVIRRFAINDKAFNGTLTDVILLDGSPGVVATWAYLDTSKVESKSKSAPAGTTCDVNVRPKFDSKLFRLEGHKLKVVAIGDTTAAMTNFAKGVDQYSAVFPSSCEEAKGKISTLESKSAAFVDAGFVAGIVGGAAIGTNLVKILQGKM